MTSAQQKATRRRKKRTAKHVVKAKEEHKEQETGLPGKQDKKTKKKKKRHVKDPIEAAQYLTSWKHRDAGDNISWKFNKNTQSWLLRHMYEPDKVSKGAFTLLLEYMDGLQGQTKIRIVADAKRRALRYKEHEKTNPQENGMVKEEKKEEESKDVDEDDETRWKRLDDHEKRKEYKRARKVLDVLIE